MNCRILITLAAITLTSLAAKAQSTYTTTGSITTSSNTFTSPTLSYFHQNYYTTVTFSSSLSGSVSLSLVGTNTSSGLFDTYLYLYSTFNPSAAQTGLLAYDDDSGSAPLSSLITYTILANTTYTAVLSDYPGVNSPYSVGDYTFTITGPTGSTITATSANAPVTAVPEPSTYGLLGAAGLLGVGLLRRRKV